MKQDEQENKLEETIKEFNIDEIREKARKEAHSQHKWVQKGVWLVCKSCKFRHGFYIGLNKVLKGFDKDGNPILEDKKKVF